MVAKRKSSTNDLQPALVKTEYGRQGKPNRWPGRLLLPIFYGIAAAFPLKVFLLPTL